MENIPPVVPSPEDFRRIASEHIRGLERPSNESIVTRRRMKSFFGVSEVVIAQLWQLLLTSVVLPDALKEIHLLWTLCFLKVYASESVLAGIWRCDEKTLRKWVWTLIPLISEINLVSTHSKLSIVASFFLTSPLLQIVWDNRFLLDNASSSKITVDGTDCPIFEPSPFDGKWFSHKFKGPGVRYEVGVGIQVPWIVWINGPYPAGRWPDLSIARDVLHHVLGPGETYIADRGYFAGDAPSLTPNDPATDEQWNAWSVLRARHETLNSRLKNFNILSRKYRHNLQRHGEVFWAVANVVQLDIQTESPLFDVLYHDP